MSLAPGLQKIGSLFEDELFLRVMTFMTGLFFLAIPILALIFKVLNQHADMALVILLGILTAFGSFLIYAAVWGSARLRRKAIFWGDSGELAFILGLITLAIPVTIAIKYIRRRKQQVAK